MMKPQKISLPYVDNVKAVLPTLAINLAVVFLFSWPDGITYAGVLLDSLICAAITVAIDVAVVYATLKKLRAAGDMPARVPLSRGMQRLPQNPFALGLLYAVVFGALTLGINALIWWFFGWTAMAFVPWMVYKLVYSTILSAKVTETVIFRYVQPDWASAGGPPPEADTSSQAKPVKNPLPKINVFKELYGSVTGNLALNIIIGTALGGVVTDPASSAVIIYPATVQSIPITGLVFGLITGILVTGGVLKSMDALILAAPPGGQLPAPDSRFTWMPVRKAPLQCLVCACLMPFSAAVLWGVMVLFQTSILNFYQYTAFITLYALLISKPLTHVLVRRCMQPDYILRKVMPIASREEDGKLEKDAPAQAGFSTEKGERELS